MEAIDMARHKILFMGEKALGLQCLKLLRNLPEVSIVAVCTRGRSDVWWGRQDILKYCAAEEISIIKREQIPAYEVDFIMSVLYPFVVEPEYIQHVRRGCFNLHEAPLPRWRGCNSYTHALLEGDAQYGTTLHELDAELDAGRIIAQRNFSIKPFETARELYERTAQQSFHMAEEWFPKILKDDYTPLSDCVNEPSFLNQRDSLAQLKQIPLDTPTHLALSKTAALDFVPWEPAFVISGDDKYYLFIEMSLGRESINFTDKMVLEAPAHLADIPWGRFTVAVVRGLPRSMMICSTDLYKRAYPLRGIKY